MSRILKNLAQDAKALGGILVVDDTVLAALEEAARTAERVDAMIAMRQARKRERTHSMSFRARCHTVDALYARTGK